MKKLMKRMNLCINDLLRNCFSDG
uniref:Uncharacterized protein n=1 Tax=Lepeophtheirus salmonis TaxID=72036 RepID=A0A0K2TFJ7_LEPSM